MSTLICENSKRGHMWAVQRRLFVIYVLSGYLLITATCACCWFLSRKMERSVDGENKVCGRNAYTVLTRASLSTHLSTAIPGRRPNVTCHQSYLTDRRALSNKGFGLMLAFARNSWKDRKWFQNRLRAKEKSQWRDEKKSFRFVNLRAKFEIYKNGGRRFGNNHD